mgnify:FL=1
MGALDSGVLESSLVSILLKPKLIEHKAVRISAFMMW